LETGPRLGGGRKRDDATGGHGIAGVDAQVEHDLLKLALIGEQRREPGLQINIEGHRARKCLREQSDEVAGEVVHVDRREAQLGLATEREDLADEAAGALGRAVDFAQALLQGGGRLGALLAEFGVAVDDREEVIKIVGDAAGEGAEALHFLGLAQFVFEALAFAHILAETEVIGDFTGRTAETGNFD
jgi:hypothetical protein